MNRVLSWPRTPLYPGLLEPLKGERLRSVLTDRGMVRFELPLGPVEMKFSDPQHQLRSSPRRACSARRNCPWRSTSCYPGRSTRRCCTPEITCAASRAPESAAPPPAECVLPDGCV